MAENHFNDLSPEERGKIPGHLVTTTGKTRCRFEMLVYFPEHIVRRNTSNPFTYRGDRWNDTEPNIMLGSLVKYFIKDHYIWHFAELYDNLYELNDCKRLVLELKNKRILTNRVPDYLHMLNHIAVPDWLKIPRSKF